MKKNINISFPTKKEKISSLKVGDMVYISGRIITGRDAAIPKLISLLNEDKLSSERLELFGTAIFHTAVSPAGIGPTSSNKVEIEGNIGALSKCGILLHIGKGRLTDKTVEELRTFGSLFGVVPPITSLLESTVLSRKVIAFEEEGIEALHELIVQDFPVIITIANGERLND